ncbi:TnsA-like heteromeric transposase endonuclease subunit [Streptomyces massasporeus]
MVVLGDLIAPCVIAQEIDDQVAAASVRGWSTRWSAAGAEVVIPVSAHAPALPPPTTVPVRQFSWRPGQRHRPGLGYSTLTGRLHGFESLAERRLLLVLDFVASAGEILSQPFTLRFTVSGRRMEHVPDFAVIDDGGSVLVVDVRPGGRGQRADAVKFAATARAATAAGWAYVLVAGWRPRAVETVEVLAGWRRAMQDRLGCQELLLAAVEAGPMRLAQLAATTGMPAVARAHLLHLLWHRRLAVDLDDVLGDASWVHPVRGGR